MSSFDTFQFVAFCRNYVSIILSTVLKNVTASLACGRCAGKAVHSQYAMMTKRGEWRGKADKNAFVAFGCSLKAVVA